MNDFVVRRARISDAPAVAELSGVLGYAVDAEVMRRRLEETGARETHAIFVAERQGVVVGWIEAAERDILVAGRVGEICGLVVAEGRRVSGVGRRLVETAEEWARGRGLSQITLRSNLIRPESHAFYERVGYTRFKTQHAYRKWLRDS
jgi:N-acetylglutamate synthase-like GNAT family acetyltransferase